MTGELIENVPAIIKLLELSIVIEYGNVLPVPVCPIRNLHSAEPEVSYLTKKRFDADDVVDALKSGNVFVLLRLYIDNGIVVVEPKKRPKTYELPLLSIHTELPSSVPVPAIRAAQSGAIIVVEAISSEYTIGINFYEKVISIGWCKSSASSLAFV